MGWFFGHGFDSRLVHLVKVLKMLSFQGFFVLSLMEQTGVDSCPSGIYEAKYEQYFSKNKKIPAIA